MSSPDENKIKLLNRIYAGFSIRFLAKVTDWSILFIPQAVFCWLMSRSILDVADLIKAIILYITIFAIPGFAITLLYNSITTTKWGGTPGKILADLKVVNEKGETLSLKRSLFRHSIGYAVSSILGGLGYFWIIKDKNKQGWHDQISGTYVIRKSKKPPFLLALIFIILLSVNISLTSSSIKNITSNKNLRKDIETMGKLLKETFEEKKQEPQIEPDFDFEFKNNFEPERT